MKSYMFLVQAWKTIIVEADDHEAARERIAVDFNYRGFEPGDVENECGGQPLDEHQIDRFSRECEIMKHEEP